MSKFKNIQNKLNTFIKKYYTNELLKGLILFTVFGLLYLLFTLFIEHFLWLKPTARTLLFWTFILIELALLTKYIILPIIKLFGLQKGISYIDASKIIGKHFKQVDDKLLNVLQLHNNTNQSELLLASIEQKSIDLEPIPFKQAINFSKNKKYLKYLAIPIMIGLVTLLINKSLFNESLKRVVNYQTEYIPPAPFSFNLDNTKLTAIQGKPFTVNVNVLGKTLPENVKIIFNNKNYFLKEESLGRFSHTFSNLDQNQKFYFEANGIQSKEYEIKIIKTPNITNFELFLNYPNYTQKSNETIKNSGNAIVPEGTTVIWKIKAKNTNKVVLSNLKDSIEVNLKKTEKNNFRHTKKIKKNLDYVIKSSNKFLKDFENLQYSINVIKDQYPKMIIKTDIDSISRGKAQFVGQISDDYGLTALNLKYYNKNDKNNSQSYSITINNSTFQEFYYVFPEGLNLNQGVDYEFYFELLDNDAVNKNKSIKSKIYHYRHKTDKELNEDVLKEEKQNLDQLATNTKNSEKLNKALEDFSKKMKNKSDMNWQDKKKLNQFVKRQKQYEEMLQRNTQKLQNNLDELKKEENPNLEQKKEDLKKRLEEIKAMQKKQDLLDELKKLAEKLDKEDFLKKLDKLTKKNKQDEKSLERILELTKRFYVEKKAEEIANKLKDLAKKQEDLAKNKNNNSEKQKELNKEFNKIKEELKELQKQNKDLKKPMDIPKKTEEQKDIDQDMKDADEKLEESEQQDQENKEQKESKKSAAQKKQKSAAKKMKKMSGEMQQAMMSGEQEMIQEDIDNLRAIIENLIKFSLEQESLMEIFKTVNASHPDYAKKLKHQQVLKEHFEHIDDSIYALLLRNPKISSKMDKDITEAHYNLDQSLANIAENKIKQGVTNQQVTMMSANNLADFLSDVLDAEQNPSQGQGSGKGGKGKPKPGFSLPDIIKKQSESLSKCQKPGNKPGEGKGKKSGEGKSDKSGESGKDSKGNKQGKGEKEGKGGKDSEQMNGEMYEIYKQQNELKEAFKDLIEKAGKKGSSGNKVLKEMEELENMLLNKGLTKQVIQKMQHIKHELLKLDKANFEQGEDNKRKSNTNKQTFKKRNIDQIKSKKLYFNPNEILNRQALPLKTIYKKKVQEYFQKEG